MDVVTRRLDDAGGAQPFGGQQRGKGAVLRIAGTRHILHGKTPVAQGRKGGKHVRASGHGMLTGMLERASKSLGIARHALRTHAFAYVGRQCALGGEQRQPLPTLHECRNTVCAETGGVDSVATRRRGALVVIGRAEAHGLQNKRGGMGDECPRIAHSSGQGDAATHRVAHDNGLRLETRQKRMKSLGLGFERIRCGIARAIASPMADKLERNDRAGFREQSRNTVPRCGALREAVQKNDRRGSALAHIARGDATGTRVARTAIGVTVGAGVVRTATGGLVGARVVRAATGSRPIRTPG